MRMKSTATTQVLVGLVFAASTAAAQQATAPKILLDQPVRAVEYQLNRLSNDELVSVERNDTDKKYRPVYLALLTRKGLAPSYRTDALAALVKLDGSAPIPILLEALAKIPADDDVTGRAVGWLLTAQPAGGLKAERATLVKAIDAAASPAAVRGAYAALLVADGDPAPAWEVAKAHDGHLTELLAAVSYLAPGAPLDPMRRQLVTPIVAVTKESTDASVRAAALDALGWTQRDAATFGVLAGEVRNGAEGAARSAAIRSLLRFPESVYPPAEVEPLARAIIKLAAATPAAARTEPASIEALQLGEKLAAALPGETGRGVRRELRALGVQVVEIGTIPEQLTYTVKWFVVEAGKPVQIVLANTDAMSHNLIVGAPGSLQAIGTAGAAMPMSADPAVKPFVPALPSVLFSTRLLQGGETERLAFTAPATPGEYIYVCTFPGHWVRMYGVMLVVPNLDEWEAKQTIPIDPMTGKPFTSRR